MMTEPSPPSGSKDHQPPVLNHPPTATSQSQDVIPSSDSMQLDHPLNQGAGSAADPEKWKRFITVVQGQHGCFKIKTGSSPIYGGFSDVWECDARLSDGTTISVALKKFRAVRIPSDADENVVTSKLLKRLNKELQIWMGLKHSNIAPLLGFVLSGELCTLSPWYPKGNVASYLGLHPEANRIRLVSDVASGLAYLHNRTPPVIHGDMKPDNVLIDATDNAVIIDFGLSSVIEDDPTLTTPFTSVSLQDAGNARWMAPELIMTTGCTRSFSTDIYSFGSVALFIYTGQLPFKGIPNIQIFHALIQGQYPVANLNDYPAISTTDAQWFYKLLVSCWSAQPNSRPSIRTVEERIRSGDPTWSTNVIPAQHRSRPTLPKTTSTAIPFPSNPSSSPPSDSILTPAAAPPSSTFASTPRLTVYQQPDEFSWRSVEPAPLSRTPRQEDPRRSYMDSYPPPAVDDRRYDGRQYDARLPDGTMDRDHDRHGPPQYLMTALPPPARPPSPPRSSLGSRVGMEPRGSAMDAPSGSRYRGSNDYDPMMTDAPPAGPSYRDDYRGLDEPRDRERFNNQRATPRAAFDLMDRLAYDSRNRERGREAERDRDYPDYRYRRDSSSSQARPFDRSSGTRVGGIHPADGTVIFVSNLPTQVFQPRLQRLFADAVGSDNVMDVNTGRAGFAFVRIRTHELAEEAVSKLHRIEFAPKFNMNVSIGKPTHEYSKRKNGGYRSLKRSIDNRPGPPGAGAGPGQGLESPAQPEQNPNKKRKKNKKYNHGNDDDSGDESGLGSDRDSTDIRLGGSGRVQMTQEEIEAFMYNAAGSRSS